MEKHENQEKITDTAYHEAGHVFAFWFLGVAFEYVTIIPENDNLGYVRKVEQSSNTKDSIIKEMKINTAGFFSEINYTKKSDSDLRHKDDKEYLCLILRLGRLVTEKELSSLIKQIKSETTDLITQNWALVERIAKKLLEKKTLTRKEIESLMKKHHL